MCENYYFLAITLAILRSLTGSNIRKMKQKNHTMNMKLELRQKLMNNE